jgi:hypothetical protein
MEEMGSIDPIITLSKSLSDGEIIVSDSLIPSNGGYHDY